MSFEVKQAVQVVHVPGCKKNKVAALSADA
jgi:hypothetical protein